MGVWGSELYSGDFAAELRAAVRAVARLPFEGDRLVETLSRIEPSAANNKDNEEYTTFWLVLADQFARIGIDSEIARNKALQIIDDGTDLEVFEKLGASTPVLAKRRKVLMAVRDRIGAAARVDKPRPVLKQPEPFLMSTGDVLVYPTSSGECINPYYLRKERIPKWKHDGWGAALIVEVGRAFDFLAWYRPMTIFAALSMKPDLSELRSVAPWMVKWPGTCSSMHFRRLELTPIGRFPVDGSELHRLCPRLMPGNPRAINDISIANELSVEPSGSMLSTEKPPIGFRSFRQSPGVLATTNPILSNLESILCS